MDEYTADAFVNREEPVPVIAVSADPDLSSLSSDKEHSESKRERLKGKLSNSRLGEKMQDANKQESGASLQDRLFSKLMQQVIPHENGDVVDDVLDERSSKYIRRPGFSLPLMTNNFRRFNARIGVVFVFQTRLIRLLNWTTPSHTLSLLAVCTFVCLDPYLLSVLPIASTLLFILVPAFLARHPPPPVAASQTSYSLHGPPLAPPRTIKPAAEMSKDFFRNMRDLQNSMDDFSIMHDAVFKALAPPTNFSNEALSSTIFLFLFIVSCTLFVASHLLPWRFLSLVICWTAIILGHPSVQKFALATRASHLRPREKKAQTWLEGWIASDIILDAPPEEREVEIFELQRRKGGQAGNGSLGSSVQVRTRFFEDVQPPTGWEWGDRKWVLDMGSKEWVEDRMVQGVEVEIEGERWVFDLAEERIYDTNGVKTRGSQGKAKVPDWEEGTATEKTGEWRRRRWVRTVRRQAIEAFE
ncbi:hypothetical protein G7Y79_00001g002370 [Physcia stellaris]|nr:hypothetical protein G7Y79_00001g002370 [Physcia stellaris]